MKQINYADIDQRINAQSMKNGSICAAISEQAIDYLLSRGELYQLRTGEVIFEYGEPGDSFFIICEGNVDFYKVHNDMCRHLREIGFGEEVGFLAMIALRDRTGDAVAREDTIVLRISSQLFSKLHQQYPFDFGIMTLNLARDMARALHQVSNDLVDASPEYLQTEPSAKPRSGRPCQGEINISAKVHAL